MRSRFGYVGVGLALLITAGCSGAANGPSGSDDAHATFTFAHGNSALRFSKIIPGFNDNSGLGDHNLSHVQSATQLLGQIDQFYSQQLADLLTKNEGNS